MYHFSAKARVCLQLLMNGFIKMIRVRRINHVLVHCNCCGVGRYDLIDIMRREFVIEFDEEIGESSLFLTDTKVDDEGDYICKITTELGSAESTFTLLVEPGIATPSVYRMAPNFCSIELS